MDYPGNEKPVTPDELMEAFPRIVQAPQGQLVRAFTARVLLLGSGATLQAARLVEFAERFYFKATVNEPTEQGNPPVYQYTVVVFRNRCPIFSV